MSKITELTALDAANLSLDDILLIRDLSAGADKKIKLQSLIDIFFSHNIPRLIPKDITSYFTDGTIWKRLNGTDGFSLFEDIYAGDYFKMSRAITCPDSTDGTTGTDWITIADIDGLWGNGDNISMMYHHLVCIPGKGFDGSAKNHFGRHRMYATNVTYDSSKPVSGTANAYQGGYKLSEMRQNVLGAAVNSGSTASGATINQQLYAEFGSHLKTTRELISNQVTTTLVNRLGSASGASSGWEWSSEQAILMSEIEVYGSTVFSSSGYDTGTAKKQLAVFKDARAINNRTSYYWLKDIASAAGFCFVASNGDASAGSAGSAFLCVRPRFVLAA